MTPDQVWHAIDPIVFMTDFITRRRLIFLLAAVLLVTVSLLFIAHVRSNLIRHVLPSYYSMTSTNVSISSEPTSTCHLSEPFDELSTCDACSAYERRSQPALCSPTGYKQLVRCTKSNTQTSRSCPIPDAVQKKHFWIFESVLFAIALVAMGGVHTRQKLLDKQMVEKIKRQIGENEE